MAAMAQAKQCDTIVVHELLAFLQNKLDVMDELSLEQICMSSYKEEEILEAKKVLIETAKTNIRLGTRTGDGRGKRDLQDIFRVFKVTDPDDVPTYVARDLCKLPPVTFDHVDVTKLLKDITSLKTEVGLINKKLESSERITAELRQELSLLRSVDAASASSSPVRNVNMRRGCAAHFSPATEAQVMTDTATETQDMELVVHPASDTLMSQIGITTPVSPLLTETYAKKASRFCQPSQPPSVCAAKLSETKKCKPPAAKISELDEEGFTLVEGKKRRSRHNRNKRGTAPGNDDIRAAVPTMLLYVSRLNQDTSDEKLLQYITRRSQSQVSAEERTLLKLSRMKSSRTTNFKSYILQIPATHKAVFLSTDFWPAGIVFRRFNEARPKPSVV